MTAEALCHKNAAYEGGIFLLFDSHCPCIKATGLCTFCNQGSGVPASTQVLFHHRPLAGGTTAEALRWAIRQRRHAAYLKVSSTVSRAIISSSLVGRTQASHLGIGRLEAASLREAFWQASWSTVRPRYSISELESLTHLSVVLADAAGEDDGIHAAHSSSIAADELLDLMRRTYPEPAEHARCRSGRPRSGHGSRWRRRRCPGSRTSCSSGRSSDRGSSLPSS